MLECVHTKGTVMCLVSIKPRLCDFETAIPKEMMGLIGAGNNPMVGMTVAVAVAIEEASK